MSVRRLAATLIALGALAGCGAVSGSSTTATSGGTRPLAPGGVAPGSFQQAPGGSVDRAAGGATDTTTGEAGSGAASAGPGTSITVGTPPTSDIERSVTAAYTVPAGGFLSSFEGVIARAVGLGGYVVSSNTLPDDSGRIVSGSVTLKVPATRIADFLNGMPTTFSASSINFASIDHTAAFVDVNARLASAHAHLDALNGLLARATSLGDITSLEQQVEAVQTEVDTDQGQLNVLTASVDLATTTVQLSERGATVVAAAPPGPVTGGVSGGWNNAVQLTGAVLEAAISVLPVLVIALAALLAWRRVSRTVVRRRAEAGPLNLP